MNPLAKTLHLGERNAYAVYSRDRQKKTHRRDYHSVATIE